MHCVRYCGILGRPASETEVPSEELEASVGAEICRDQGLRTKRARQAWEGVTAVHEARTVTGPSGLG